MTTITRFRRIGPILVLLLTILRPAMGADDPPGFSPKITPSPQTTHATKPLNDRGYVDYAGAFDAQNREGVSADENAAVLLWSAIGPETIPAHERERFFRRLGISPLPEAGPYFRLFPEGMTTNEDGAAFSRRLDALGAAPWDEKSDPQIAGWLAANEAPLATIARASRRARYYSPRWCGATIEGREPMMQLELTDLQILRQVARVLAARASLRIRQGRLDEAWEDLQVCHRLARLVGTEGFMMSQLIGMALDGFASRVDQVLAVHGSPTAEQALRYSADLAALAPLPSVAVAAETFERWSLLDAITLAAQCGLGSVSQLGDRKAGDDEETTLAALEPFVDWNSVLRYANGWYDRVAAAIRTDDRDARSARLGSVLADLRAVRDTLPGRDLRERGFEAIATEIVSKTFVVLMFPAMDQAVIAHKRAAARISLSRIALGLAAIRARSGTYPQTLTEVASAIGELPLDPFSGEGFKYRSIGAGYVLYSVGDNGRDDQAATWDSVPQGDDIRVLDEPASSPATQHTAGPPPVPLPRPNNDPLFSAGAKTGMAVALIFLLAAVAFLVRRAGRRS